MVTIIITGKKVGVVVGSLALLASTLTAISNICFDKSFSYIAISVGFISGGMLLMICSKKSASQN